jgi:hypothetical protein
MKTIDDIRRFLKSDSLTAGLTVSEGRFLLGLLDKSEQENAQLKADLERIWESLPSHCQHSSCEGCAIRTKSVGCRVVYAIKAAITHAPAGEKEKDKC